MRTYDNDGNGFTVTFSERDADEWAERWPGSNVQGRGSFSFAENGIVSVSGSAQAYGGDDWDAFMGDCREWGQTHIEALRRRHAIEAVAGYIATLGVRRERDNAN